MMASELERRLQSIMVVENYIKKTTDDMIKLVKGKMVELQNLLGVVRSPASLRELCFDYVADHAENIESLNGFPSLIGEQIFKLYVEKVHISNKFNHMILSLRKETDIQIFRTFIAAYGNLVLESLDLSEQLLLINDHIDELSHLCLHITELNLNSCDLGDFHDMMTLIPQMFCLKTLYLKDNSLTDEGIRIMTLPLRMFNQGNKELEILDLSSNNITDKVIPWLSKYKNLQLLNLTNAAITELGIQMLEKNCQMIKCIDFDFKSIKTTGWATPIFESWKRKLENHYKQKAKMNDSQFRVHIYPHQNRLVSPLPPRKRQKLTHGSSLLIFKKKSMNNEESIKN